MEGINLLIEKHKMRYKFVSYIETIVDFAKEHDIEVEEIVDSIDKNLKKKVEVEFIKNNWFPNKKIETSLDSFMEE